MKIVLDTNVVGKLCHPNNKKYKGFVESFLTILESGEVDIYFPEIADYELRRKMLQMSKNDPSWNNSLSKLDNLKQTLSFLAIDSSILSQAAQNWADAKNSGKQTGPDDALDGDSILAAQAMEIGGKVVTENEKHISIFCEVLHPDKFIDDANKLLSSTTDFT